ncbi:Uncharacterised protein [uncultured archaeon]|nr:Uncharacterised protein [uncultured archaeon]
MKWKNLPRWLKWGVGIVLSVVIFLFLIEILLTIALWNM